MISDLLAVAKDLVDMTKSVGAIQAGRRVELADHIAHISACVRSIADAMSQTPFEPPYAACAELELYGETAAATLERAIGEARAEQIASRLRAATYTRKGMIASGLGEGSSKAETTLRELRECQGHLTAIANTLRVTNLADTR